KIQRQAIPIGLQNRAVLDADVYLT
ncbi:unnamed protein product, partial [Rotaria sordida]